MELMSSKMIAVPQTRRRAGLAQSPLLPVLGIALGVFFLHLFTNGLYDFHRDELQFLSDARHLDWGFAEFPPLTPFLARISIDVFGLSMMGLRSVCVLAQTIAVIMTAMMALDLGGGRLAQATAALAIALSPVPLLEGTEFQYSSFDYLWWVLAAYFTIRLLKSEDPRWWLAIGASLGLGLLTKYSIVFFIAGILSGMIFSGARRYFANIWFWGGIAVALAISFPNLLWQVRHDFISYSFLEYVHTRDVNLGHTGRFLTEQLFNCVNVFAAPLCLAGLIGYLNSRRYLMLGWMYLVPLALFTIGQGRGYYLAPAYPMLIAMGCVAGERWVALTPKLSPAAAKALRDKKTITSRRRARSWRRAIAALFFAGLLASGVRSLLIIVPLQNSGPIREYALKNNWDLSDRFGWKDLVQTAAKVRDSLPHDQQAHLGIISGNYGEQGAFDVYGPEYHLPQAIGGMNSAWQRGYPTPQPTTLIVIGFTPQLADSYLTDCRLVARNSNAEGVENEESEHHPYIFLCGPPKKTWPEFWVDFQHFG
jgi:4-amino-4-deoxy-L-arabinose transferase-like glycosyltransferase